MQFIAADEVLYCLAWKNARQHIIRIDSREVKRLFTFARDPNAWHPHKLLKVQDGDLYLTGKLWNRTSGEPVTFGGHEYEHLQHGILKYKL